MTFSTLPRLRDWRAALMLVVVACAAPGRATAMCGDDVVLQSDHVHARPDGRAATAPARGAERPKAPCSGPNCSQTPERQPAPFAPAPAPQGKEVAQVLDSIEPADGAQARACYFISPRPIHRPSSVFHPPRLG